MASPLRKNFLQRFALAGVAFTLCAVCVMSVSGASETQHQIKLAVPGQKLSFSPESDSDLKKLKEEIDLFLGAEKHPSLDGLSKNQVRALEILRELAGESLATTESGERRAIQSKI